MASAEPGHFDVRVTTQHRCVAVKHGFDVEVKLGFEGDGLLVGHYLEEVEVPASFPPVTLPDERTDGVVVRIYARFPRIGPMVTDK
jgi:hypothetical protein